MTTSSREIGRNALLSAAGNLALPLSTLLTAPMLARGLGVDGRGEFAAATAPLMLVLTIAMFGLPEALIYLTASARTVSRRGFRNTALLLAATGVIAALATYVSAPVISGGSDSVEQLIRTTSLAVVPSVLIGAPRALASGLNRWGLVNLEKAITGTLRLTLMFGAFLTDTLTVATATLIVAAAPLLAGIPYLALIRGVREAPRLENDGPSGKASDLLGYGWRVWLGSVSGILLSRLSQVLLLPLGGPTALGQFAVAMNVSDASLLLNSAIRDVTLTADAADRADARLTATARVSLLLSLFGGGILIASLPLWFVWLFGEDFRGAIPATIVLIAVSVLGVSGSIAGAGLAARGHPELRSISLLIALVANVSTLFLLVPALGALGAAIATALGSLIASNLNILFMKTRFGLRFRDYYLIRRADVKGTVRLVNSMMRRGSRS